MKALTYPTRIGTVVHTEHIASLTGARDIGGAIVTRTGRVVIAAGISDGNLDYPYKIAITDDGARTVREVFSMPAEAKISVAHSGGVDMPDEETERYQFSADMAQVSFPYRKTCEPAYVCARIVLANRANAHRPVFIPRIGI